MFPTAVQGYTSEHETIAHEIVKRNMLWSMGVGVVAIPIVDLVGVAAVQVKMLRELSKLYDVSFSEDIGKHLIASLTAGLGAPRLAMGGLGSLIKSIPGFGTIFGAVSVSVMAGALTWAVGRVFMSHYESGGNMLNFKPAEMRRHFHEQFEKGKEMAAQANQES